MGYLTGVDVSRWQGNIDWAAVPHPIAILKMTGGDDGLYVDSKANANYYGAKAAGKAIGMYHFAGGQDPVNEADFFIAACSPLEENDVMVLDWEIKHADPVGWSEAFVNRVHDRTGVWPLLYVNGSTWNAYDWSRVTTNCGVWVAWYDRDPEGDLPVGGKTYVMHQYTDKGSVRGVVGDVDMNAWFGTLAQFKLYGFHNKVAPAPSEPPSPVVSPTPVPPTPVEPAPTPTPVPNPEPTDPIVVDPTNPPESPVEVIPAERPYNFQAILIRAFSTFYQAFIGVFGAGIILSDFSKASLFALVSASIAAGVSAVKNLIVRPQEAK